MLNFREIEQLATAHAFSEVDGLSERYAIRLIRDTRIRKPAQVCQYPFNWKGAGLPKPSLVKRVLTIAEPSLIIRTLGGLEDIDMPSEPARCRLNAPAVRSRRKSPRSTGWKTPRRNSSQPRRILNRSRTILILVEIERIVGKRCYGIEP